MCAGHKPGGGRSVQTGLEAHQLQICKLEGSKPDRGKLVLELAGEGGPVPLPDGGDPDAGGQDGLCQS